MGILLSGALFICAILTAHDGHDILAAAEFIASAIFYLGGVVSGYSVRFYAEDTEDVLGERGTGESSAS